MNLADKAARGGGVTLAFQAVKFIVQTASLILLARLLTPEDFGIVAMVVAITGAADLIRDFGLSLAAVQAKQLSDAERTNLFWANTGIGFVCCVVVSAAAPLIVWIYDKPELLPIVFAVAGVFIVSGAATQFRAELMRSLRFTALSTTDVLANAIGVGTAVVLALSGAGYWAIVAQLIMVAVATLFLSAVICRWRPGLPRRGVSIKRFFRFGGGLLGTQLLGYATKNIDSIAIGAMYGPTTLGLYNRAYQLLMTPLNQINAPLTNVALPILSKVQDNPVIYGRYLARAQLIGGYFTASVLAVSAGVAEPLITVAFGEQWPAVAPIFALLAIGGVFRSVAQICYWTDRRAVAPVSVSPTCGHRDHACRSPVGRRRSRGSIVDRLSRGLAGHSVARAPRGRCRQHDVAAELLARDPPVRRTGRTARICRISPVCRTIRVLGSRHILRPGRSYPLRNALSHCPKRFDHYARLREKSRWPSSSSSEGTCRPKFTARLWRTRRPQARVHRFGEHDDAVELPDYRQEPMAHFHDGIGDDTGCRLFHDSLDATHLHRQI